LDVVLKSKGTVTKHRHKYKLSNRYNIHSLGSVKSYKCVICGAIKIEEEK